MEKKQQKKKKKTKQPLSTLVLVSLFHYSSSILQRLQSRTQLPVVLHGGKKERLWFCSTFKFHTSI